MLRKNKVTRLDYSTFEDNLELRPILFNHQETGYLISNTGVVISLKSNKRLAPAESVQGYLNVTLYLNGIGCRKTIHRLVAEAFIPNPENKRTVNHKDGNCQNNMVHNLEWATHKENTRHGWETGLMSRCSRNVGTSSGRNIYSEKDIHRVCKLLAEGVKTIKVARKTGVNRQVVDSIKRGLIWKTIGYQYDIVPPKPKANYSPELRLQIKELMNAGHNNREIMSILELPNTSTDYEAVQWVRRKDKKVKGSTIIDHLR